MRKAAAFLFITTLIAPLGALAEEPFKGPMVFEVVASSTVGSAFPFTCDMRMDGKTCEVPRAFGSTILAPFGEKFKKKENGSPLTSLLNKVLPGSFSLMKVERGVDGSVFRMTFQGSPDGIWLGQPAKEVHPLTEDKFMRVHTLSGITPNDLRQGVKWGIFHPEAGENNPLGEVTFRFRPAEEGKWDLDPVWGDPSKIAQAEENAKPWWKRWFGL